MKANVILVAGMILILAGGAILNLAAQREGSAVGAAAKGACLCESCPCGPACQCDAGACACPDCAKGCCQE